MGICANSGSDLHWQPALCSLISRLDFICPCLTYSYRNTRLKLSESAADACLHYHFLNISVKCNYNICDYICATVCRVILFYSAPVPLFEIARSFVWHKVPTRIATVNNIVLCVIRCRYNCVYRRITGPSVWFPSRYV